MRPPVWLTLAAVAAIAAVAGYWGASAGSERQDEVAERGSVIMPFDLDRTTHIFKPLPDGGVQTVVADDPRDMQQIGLIQAHLREEAAAFQKGTFTDPAFIHGEDMPGLGELRAGVDRVEVCYEETATGARIRYLTSDSRLVDAIHRWFAAQTSDHGAHAQHDS